MPLVLPARAFGGRSKYRAVPVWYCPACDACRLAPCPQHPAGAVRYASKAEAWYWWATLRPQVAAGVPWERQQRYPLRLCAPDGRVVDFGTYTADFCLYPPGAPGRVIDVKGKLTRDGALRLKLMIVCHGIHVELVKSTPPKRWLEEE